MRPYGGLLSLAAIASACSDSADLAAGVAIANVDLYQGPRVPLVRNGQLVLTRDLPVIAGRGGRIAIKAVVRGGAEPRFITARAIFESTETDERITIEREVGITGSGTVDAELDIEPGVIQEHQSLAVELVESSRFASKLAIEDSARQPLIPLDARVSRFRIVIVPMGDPAPVIDGARVDRYRDALAAWLPVDRVDLTLAPPLAFPRPLRTSDDFQDALGVLAAWRAAQNFDPDVFAYAPVGNVFGAEVGGMAANLAVSPPYWRVAAGSLAINPEIEVTTLVHEIGHLLGRSHVSCGNPAGPDFSYPYDDGSIGVPGIDQRDGEMRLPDTHVDYMSYCLPAFVSDYGFAATYRGLSALNERASFVGEPSFIADPVRPGQVTE